MFKAFSAFAIGALALLAAGCNGNTKFIYAADSGSFAAFPDEKPTATVVVPPFMVERGEDSRMGSSMLGLIPLVPFGYAEMNQPENNESFYSITYYDFSPANDLAQAAAVSLRASKLFARVDQCRASKSDAKYELRGTVLATDYKARWFTYGITYFLASPLWIVGCPTGSSSCHLAVRFDLIDRASGANVWEYTFDESDYINHWLYCRYGDDVNLFPVLMKRAMNKALAGLASSGVLQ